MTPNPSTATSTETFTTQIFATPAKALRSRFIGAFLLLNWGIMGWFTVRAPSLGYAALTLSLGVLGFVGGFSQIRAARRARELPMVRWNDEIFAFRGYTQSRWIEFPWQRLTLIGNAKPSNAARPEEDHIAVTITEPRIFFLGWATAAAQADDRRGVDDVAPRNILDLELFEKQDQQRIVDTVRRKTQRVGTSS